MRLFAVLVLVAVTGESARACPGPPRCTCLDDRRVTPHDEADVSPDTKIWISSDLGPGKVTLFGPGGPRALGVLPKAARSSWRGSERYRFDPGPLEPGAEYRVRVDDEEVTRFTTAREATPVTEPVIRRFEATTVTYGLLTPDHRLDLDLWVPDDAVALELTVRSDREWRTVRTKRDGWFAVADPICAADFDAPVGTVVCLDVTAIGADENRSSTTTNCITAGTRTHDEWFEMRLVHGFPSCSSEAADAAAYAAYVSRRSDPRGPVLSWLLGTLGFVLSLARIAWQSRAPTSSRPGDAFVVERVAERAVLISKAVLLAAAIACSAAIVSGELTDYVSFVLGLALHDVVRYARARHVMRAARAGTPCAIGDGYVGVDGSWLHVRRGAIERAEAPAIPAARAMK